MDILVKEKGKIAPQRSVLKNRALEPSYGSLLSASSEQNPTYASQNLWVDKDAMPLRQGGKEYHLAGTEL